MKDSMKAHALMTAGIALAVILVCFTMTAAGSMSDPIVVGDGPAVEVKGGMMTGGVIEQAGSTGINTPDTISPEGILNSEVIGGNCPTTMIAGRSYIATIKFLNTGDMTWTTATGIGIASYPAYGDASKFGWTRKAIQFSSGIAPGTYCTVSLPLTAPAAGSYQPAWCLYYIPDGRYFGQYAYTNIQVNPAATLNAAYTWSTLPMSMTTAQTRAGSITFRNTGTEGWPANGAVKLGGRADVLNFGATRIPLTTAVAPGASRTFSFNLKAPTTEGTYNLKYQMIKVGDRWFGKTHSHQITVTGGGGVKTALVESNILTYINAERAEHGGLPALTSDPVLGNIARVHSSQMATRKFFDHTNPFTGLGPVGRLGQAGYPYLMPAGTWRPENIGFASWSPTAPGAAAIAHTIVDAWMASTDGHREAILSANVNTFGTGAASSKTFSYVDNLGVTHSYVGRESWLATTMFVSK
ncbi:MAG: CAP domain-containing protein [Methanoregulaceae archaeon]|nr:CAP domain-containing protein [Methanoregulaceae archaeon]